MNWTLSFEPFFSPTTLGFLLVPVALFVLASLIMRKRGAWVRLIAAAALALALFNPVVMQEERDPLKSVVAIVVDRSQSQTIDGRDAQTDRTLANIQEKLARFPEFEARVVELTQQAGASGTQTRLFETLNNALRDVPPSRVGGAIMITDGQVHDVPGENFEFPAPLHALITGREGEIDRRVRFEQAPRFGLVNNPLYMTYRVLGAEGETGSVNVRVSINGEPITTESADIGEESALEILVPNAGRNIVELEVDPVPGELTDTNNRTIALVDGIRENLRVLLVSGEPHAGERTWRNLLKSDTSVDLVHFTILRPPERQDGTPISELSLIAFPTRELFVEKIGDFDLIIFDRYQHRDVLPLLYYDYIAEYVQNGGALLVAAGPEYAGEDSISRTPLFPALPGQPTGGVIEEPFRPELTDLGKRHPVTRDLEGAMASPPEWSRWFRLIQIANPQGDVVMQGANNPLLLLSRIGEGRVGMLLSDQGWLWARGFEGGGPYAALYRRVAHWLMKEPELEEERLTAAGDGMTLSIRRQTMADNAEHAEIITPGGETRRVTLAKEKEGLFTAQLDVSEIGLYRIANGNLNTLAHVGPVNAPEFADMISTTSILQPTVENTYGIATRIENAVPDLIPIRNVANASTENRLALKPTGDTVLRSVRSIPLFAGFAGLGILLLAMGAMWYREGR
ncbi:hypothetical protein [Limoniibacter endophyticus]|uniref:Membrane protein n=1 Tax=Limoniibacter endophyticus TaxID=1565040 RepID=A0A8J3DMT5_9HYPH|nr:hypothetical protein [Limoniibacter endophyticus]GHC65507.1 membrane protein [Limoniibacter endophyticus]